MLSKVFVSSAVLLAGLVLPAVQAQIIGLDALILDTAATCPADAPPGTDIDATVLAVVDFAETLTANVNVLGQPVAEAATTVDLQVCLCLDANVPLPLVTLPVNLEPAALVDLQAYIAANPTLTLLQGLLANPAVETDLNLVPIQRRDCTCPVGATPTCDNGVCGCDCGPGATYNAVTGQCVLSASTLPARRRRRNFDN